MARYWNFIKNAASETSPESVELRIEGDIVSSDDSWIYEWFGIPCASPNDFRNELSQYKGKDITVWIDSYGGDVFAATGIYNALKEHDGNVTVKIDGKAMSAASVIAMAGDKILMSPVSIMMIHNPLTYVQGDMRDMRKAADVLDTVKQTIVNAYAAKTKKPQSKISSMMDDETWMSADTAVKEGFADGVLYREDNNSSSQSVVNFAFNRISIQNSAKQSLKHFFELENINRQPNAPKNNEEEEKLVDLKELKDKYPEIFKAAFEEGRQDGVFSERERLKGIDEIADNADPELVNKAKYEEPMDVKDLAVEIIRADASKGKKYLDSLNNDAAKGGVKDVPPALGDPKDNNTEAGKIKNAASQIASHFSRK